MFSFNGLIRQDLEGNSDSLMSDQEDRQETNAVCESWSQMVQAILGIVLVAGAGVMLHYYAPAISSEPPPSDLQQQVHALTKQVEQLEQDRGMPTLVLNKYRNSIGYIYGVYQVGFPNQRPTVRARVSGTGFIVSNGLLATNRHVAEPWYGDPEAQKLIDQGATGTIESLVGFFPNSPTPVTLSPGSVSRNSDLAVLRAEDSALVHGLAVLPLAKSPGAPG